MKGKFILTLQNIVRFDLDEYDDAYKIKSESTITYNPISSQVRQEAYNLIGISEIKMQDKLIELGSITE